MIEALYKERGSPTEAIRHIAAAVRHDTVVQRVGLDDPEPAVRNLDIGARRQEADLISACAELECAGRVDEIPARDCAGRVDSPVQSITTVAMRTPPFTVSVSR